uniref:Monocarboxylate transporter 2 n=1 Tax=Lygus hesperus TaxID=30085 RepID=A0A0A9WGX5_LYGHE
MLVCGMFCSIVIGSLYAFSLITHTLSDVYKFSQNDITTISTVGIVVGYLTFPFGILYDYYGPKPILLIGVICICFGTLLFAFTFDNTIGHSVGGLAIINAIFNLGTALFDMGTVITVLSWFPLDRGFVVGCLKTMTGLGSSFLSTLYGAYFNNNNTTYMYFLLAISASIGVVAMFISYLPPYHMTGHREKIYT